MACYYPLQAYRARTTNESGARPIVFSRRAGYEDLPIKLACGQCVGCRLERSRQWAVRCLHEAKLHERNCFITLTYNDANVPVGNSLCLPDFQKFMKRLRKEMSPQRVRFFHCGEYMKSFIPHYHALLFGKDWKDKVKWSVNGRGDILYRSPSLEKLWPFGFSLIGDVTFESAAYVARYVLKKVVGDRDDLDRLVLKDSGEVLSPEYVTMSRRPGIGTSWFNKYMSDVYPRGKRVIRGRDMRPPRFYDSLYKAVDPLGFEDLKFSRLTGLDKLDNIPARLAVKEEVTVARIKLLPRRLEE